VDLTAHDWRLSTLRVRSRAVDRKTHPAKNAVLHAALAAGQKQGQRWRILARRPRTVTSKPDAFLRLQFGGRAVVYAAEVRQALRPATLGAAVHQLRAHGKSALLVADHVTPPLADTLRARGVQFIDAAGNAYLAHPPLLVFVKGQRPADPAAIRGAEGRAFQASGLRVLFALLCRPELVGRPYRDIAALAGAAHGSVGWVMAELPKLGHLAVVGGRRRILDGERLLAQWVEAYARTLCPKLLLGRYRAERLDFAEKIDATRYHVLLGGESAAARLTRHLRPGTVSFYADKVEPRLVLDQRLRADPEGNVEFRRRFWTFESEARGLVPALLVYADLLAIGDARCLETATLLRERLVARFL